MLSEEEIKLEKEHLKDVYKKIGNEIEKTQSSISQLSNFLSEQVVTSSEDFYAMDEEERAETKTVYDNINFALEKFSDKLNTIKKLENSCYFGSFIFNSENFSNIYVGITGFSQENHYPLICDWRAPICSLFYDYELGNASYKVGDKTYSGTILQKRQYKVKKDELLYAIDCTMSVSDEVLKRELANNKTDKMQNIVATIQKEQNVIIRNQSTKNMIVQGCAGSGKTSIALHRVAYLLYAMRDELKSDNVLVISPSAQFSEYISNVLPELAENAVSTKIFADYAHENLKFILETKSQMSARLKNFDKLDFEDYSYKNSFAFVDDLKQYMLTTKDFNPKDFVLGKDVVPKEELNRLFYETFSNLMPCERIENISTYVCEKLNLPDILYDRVKSVLFRNLNVDVLEYYNNFLKNNEKIAKKSKNNDKFIKFEDFAPILLIKNYFYKIQIADNIKLVVVDEYENYSACEFEFLKEMYDSKFLIVGDLNQAVYKKFDKNYLKTLSEMFDAEIVLLNKSYRSTKQISIFNNKLKNLNFEFIDRDGDEVEIKTNLKDNFDYLVQLTKNQFNTMAILTKDEEQSLEIYNNLKDRIKCSYNEFKNGYVLISSLNFVQGLEFDFVVVADYDKYISEIDKNILYNLTTRATNKLCLLSY